ncbi:MAG TPA: hypothetical protein VLS89_09790 [Candidatus Nanopelagicales bacterium]|nr:hypothetical protein [Candidatus Nanopelagicales bacterium]
MTKLSLASVTLDDISRLAALESRGVTREPWDGVVELPDEQALAQLRYLTAKLAQAQPTTLNEATIWSRAIYPLLELAETGRVRAWAEVPLSARDPYTETELAGIVDGVLASEGVLAGAPGLPFLLVVEAKRGMDATDPRPQLLGAILAVLWAGITRAGGEGTAEAFGCFTVGDIWTFVRAEAVVRPAGSEPRLGVSLSWSREYAERAEAEAILRVLRWITQRYAT